MTKEQKIFRLAEILVKSYREELTGEEKDVLEQWLKEDERHRILYEHYAQEEFLHEKNQEAATIDWQTDYKQFMHKHALSRPKLQFRAWMKYAAILILPIALSIILWPKDSQNDIQSEIAQNTTLKKAFPVLTLGTGDRIVLSDSAKVPETEGIQISKGNQNIVYRQPSDSSRQEEKTPVYNRLEIPRGAEYILTLADGTTIWLNSESEIRYPVHFNQSKREVFLKGEAFFKVAKDSLHAFIVHTTDANIEVLGTEFSVRNYLDETTTTTTLVNGSVRLTSGKTNHRIILKPGEQGCVTKTDGQIKTREVDTYLYTAWKDARFVFRNTRMEEILNTLARWYDLTIFYQNNAVKDICFSGDMPRMADFHQLLNIIEGNERVGFRVKDRTITVIQK